MKTYKEFLNEATAESRINESQISHSETMKNGFQSLFVEWVRYLNNEAALKSYKIIQDKEFYLMQNILSDAKTSDRFKKASEMYMEDGPSQDIELSEVLLEASKNKKTLNLLGQYAQLDSRTGGSNFLSDISGTFDNSIYKTFAKYGLR